ncbi:hypothetical protein L2U69_14540 [Zavarzinia compransoris]|uniref:hypothetical protein n=1 Tax=Zavarzinia marina TaxID=2911065 RepID=UPI001F460ED3|nr:hypothetical protein [Zavarzinia marina]MCF4166868.1 hypothetical protein [Zavarzinia marina]
MREFLVLAAAALGLGACAEWSTVQYKFDNWTNEPYVATIDAKQRVIVAVPGEKRITENADGEAVTRTDYQVCVEQSPDVFSFLSASGSLSVETKEAVAKAVAALAESGGSMAFRTQLTQAQSNLLYNICALAAGGRLSDRAARAELRRFQNTLLAALAIEQMTSPNRGPIASLVGGTSAANLGEGVEAARKKLDAATATLTDLQAKERDAKAAAEKDPPPAGAKEDYDAAKAATKKAEGDVETATKVLEAAEHVLSATASGTVGGTMIIDTGNGNGVNQHVAAAVVQVVDTALNRGVLIDNCVEYLFEGNAKESPAIFEECSKVFAAYTNAYVARQDAITQMIQANSKLIALASEKCSGANASSRECAEAVGAAGAAAAATNAATGGLTVLGVKPQTGNQE